MTLKGWRNRILAAVFIAAPVFSSLTSPAAFGASPPARKATHIPAQDLASALKALEQDRHRQVIFLEEDVRSLHTTGASGELTFDEAILQILSGTGLTYQLLDDGTVSVLPARNPRPFAQPPPPRAAPPTGKPSLKLAEQPSADELARAKANDRGTALDASALPEVVVTATRREESLNRVPISITAMSQDTIDRRGIHDITELARFTPGLKIDRTGTNNVSIRGISATGGASTTGIYIDDTPIQIRGLASNGVDALPQPFDLDRIEVLRGPQGTLFGAGSEGGTLRYITTPPDLSHRSLYTRSEISYTQGGAPSYEVGIGAGAPIIDGTLGVRATVWLRRDGGWVDRIDPSTLALVDRDSNHRRSALLRLAAEWAAAPGWKVTPAMYYQEQRGNDLSIYWPIYSDPSRDRYVSANPNGRPTPDRFVLPSLRVQGDFGPMSLISSTSFLSRDVLSTGYDGTIYDLGFFQTVIGIDRATNTFRPGFPLIDAGGIHLPPSLQDFRPEASVRDTQRNFTQEVRVQSADSMARFVWTVGLFYASNRQTERNHIYDPDLERFTTTLAGRSVLDVFHTPLLPSGDDYLIDTHARDMQRAVFGELTFGLSDRWKLTGGARYSRTEFSFDVLTAGPQLFGPTQTGHGLQSEGSFTPKLGLSFQKDEDNLYYATYAKGFRPGGGNNPIPQVACQADFQSFGITQTPLTYHSDTTQSFEIGAKNSFDGRARLATSVYYIKWDGIQQSVQLPICALSFVSNLGTAVAKGADLQADLLLTRNLTLQLAVGYTDARFTRDSRLTPEQLSPVAASGDAVEGRDKRPAAPYSASAGLQYGFVALDHAFYIRSEYQYEARSRWPGPSQDTRTLQYSRSNFALPGTGLASLRAGVRLGGWNLAAFVENLTDAHTLTTYDYSVSSGIGASRLVRYRSLMPRTFGLQVTRHD